MKKLILFLVVILGSTNTLLASTWYVNINATGANTGLNWTDAFPDLQDAIAASGFGDEIWVAAGVYKPTNTATRTIYFSIKNGTKVYGGFAGTETLLSERNPTANLTVLSGEIGTGATTDNSFHVVYFSNIGNQTRLEGFTITAGRGSGSYGGGIYSTDSSPTIENCKLISNYADFGGALSHRNSGIITVNNCLFEGNSASDYGGAIYLATNTSNFTGCYFKSNQSSNIGGAAYITGSSNNFNRCVFAGNISDADGSVFNVGNTATLNLSNSLLVGNYSGGTEVISSMPLSNTNEHTITNCTIAHNNQLNNGQISSAITMNNVSRITNSIIWGNGGQAQVLGTGTIMNNCIMQTGIGSASGTNILYIDPQFVLPGAIGGAAFDTTGLDYHLGILSPGINYGLNAEVSGSADLDGNTRIQSTVDLGAYETNYCNSALTFDQTAPFTICGGTPITLSLTGAVAYQWSTGDSGSSISVSSAGTYSVVFEDTSGCRGNLTATVVSSNLPSPTITFSGGNLSTGSFSTYQWSFNGSPINGATSASHIPLEGYGEYTVEVTNSGGCTGSDSYCLSPAAISANGPTTFCTGSSVTLTAENGSSFVWSNGELDSEITVSTSGTYTVTVMNSNAGCAVTLSQQISVVANPIPTINYSGGNLVTGAFSSYQWYYNGNVINGATSSSLTPVNGNGQYTVVVTNSTGCIGTSAIYNYSNVGLDEVVTDVVSIFPNPVEAAGTLHINTNLVAQEAVTIRLYDLTGKMCFEYYATEIPTSLELSGINAGVYIVELTVDQTTELRQQIVLR